MNDGATAIKAWVVSSGRWGLAVLAEIVVGAGFGVSSSLINQVVGNVLLARAVGNTVFVGVLVDESGLTTVAVAASLAVDDNLGVQTDRGGVAQACQDVESISKGRGCALGPAATAVPGNVLILIPGEVVAAVNVAPVHLSGQHIHGKLLVRNLDFTVRVRVLLDTAASGLIHKSTAGSVNRAGLREGVDSLVVVGVVLLLLGGDVLDAFSPGVLGHTPVTVAFNHNVVDTSHNLEEALFTPV